MSDDSAQSPSRQVACDLLVVGSGAAGLSAAVTAAAHGLKVVVVEKDPVMGGASAWSGGWMWVPCNPLSRAEGIVEDPELARTYLRHELGGNFDAAKVDAFLAAGPRMVEFFQKHTELQFVSGTRIADIHGNTPGAGAGGRSVAPVPFDGRCLGAALLNKARRQKYETSLFGTGIMAGPDHKPNPCVAPIEKPPFYAIKVLPGSFGTFAGLATDTSARVLDADGKPIEGLYAAPKMAASDGADVAVAASRSRSRSAKCSVIRRTARFASRLPMASTSPTWSACAWTRSRCSYNATASDVCSTSSVR